MGNDRKMGRREVRDAVQCPECGAAKASACVGARAKPRTANHQGRVVAAEAATSDGVSEERSRALAMLAGRIASAPSDFGATCEELTS